MTDFQIRPGEEFTLAGLPTKVDPFFKSKKEYRKQLKEQVGELKEHQRMHYGTDVAIETAACINPNRPYE